MKKIMMEKILIVKGALDKMKSKTEKNLMIFLILVVLVVLTCLKITGCTLTGVEASPVDGSDRNIGIGYIDSDRLFSEFPELIRFMEEKRQKSVEVRAMLTGGKQPTKAQSEKIARETEKFIQLENQHLKVFVDTIKRASAKVADEKKLDIIINNKSSERVLEYGGIDVTEEVRMKIRELNESDDKSKQQ
jgi:Skp family chaperone for outer membrane proteins